jgi:hypothetical protein
MAAAIAVVVATVWNGRGVDAKGLRGVTYHEYVLHPRQAYSSPSAAGASSSSGAERCPLGQGRS